MARKPASPAYYKALPGSRELSTSSGRSAKELKRLENTPRGQTAEIEYSGEILRKGPAPESPRNLYDEIMPRLDALEQALLGHLYRLSYGEGANWVRVGKKELARRTGLSHRRLLKALSGLAEKNIIRPLHRDTDGTMYKMYTVDKMLPVSAPKDKHLPKAPETATPKKRKIAPQRAKTLESPINEEAFPGEQKVLTMGEIAAEFFKTAGKRPSDVDMDSALAQITYLLEDGFSREEVLKTALFVARSFGKKADISKLPYYIHQAIADQES